MLCDHLEGWDREGGREGDARGRSYGDICILQLIYFVIKQKLHTIVKQLYSNKDVKKKKSLRIMPSSSPCYCSENQASRWLLKGKNETKIVMSFK